jgi:hypothetical protein
MSQRNPQKRSKETPVLSSVEELSLDGFGELVDAIVALGYEENIAAHYAALIGDTPVCDKAGNIVVQDWRTGEELARLSSDFFDKKNH